MILGKKYSKYLGLTRRTNNLLLNKVKSYWSTSNAEAKSEVFWSPKAFEGLWGPKKAIWYLEKLKTIEKRVDRRENGWFFKAIFNLKIAIF